MRESGAPFAVLPLFLSTFLDILLRDEMYRTVLVEPDSELMERVQGAVVSWQTIGIARGVAYTGIWTFSVTQPLRREEQPSGQDK